MTISLIDTSVFCELLRVPGMDQDHERCLGELKEKIGAREHLLLPLATILETGNHIGQCGDGHQRRQAAQRFVEQVKQAVDGASPFVPTSPIDATDLKHWLDDFPDSAMQGMGLGDLSIVKEWERQRVLHPGRRVTIWSKDLHLKGYDTA